MTDAGEARRFRAELREGRGGGAFVEVPFDVKAVFGSGRPKVRASFDGNHYRGSIASMGGVWCLGVRKDIRSAIGRDVGDEIDVVVALDDEPRTVDVPAELAEALDEAGLRERFDDMAFTHRREYVEWIVEAKRKATRERRIGKAVEMIRQGGARHGAAPEGATDEAASRGGAIGS